METGKDRIITLHHWNDSGDVNGLFTILTRSRVAMKRLLDVRLYSMAVDAADITPSIRARQYAQQKSYPVGKGT